MPASPTANASTDEQKCIFFLHYAGSRWGLVVWNVHATFTGWQQSQRPVWSASFIYHEPNSFDAGERQHTGDRLLHHRLCSPIILYRCKHFTIPAYNHVRRQTRKPGRSAGRVVEKDNQHLSQNENCVATATSESCMRAPIKYRGLHHVPCPAGSISLFFPGWINAARQYHS